MRRNIASHDLDMHLTIPDHERSSRLRSERVREVIEVPAPVGSGASFFFVKTIDFSIHRERDLDRIYRLRRARTTRLDGADPEPIRKAELAGSPPGEGGAPCPPTKPPPNPTFPPSAVGAAPNPTFPPGTGRIAAAPIPVPVPAPAPAKGAKKAPKKAPKKK